MTSSGLTNHEGGWEQAFAQMFDMSTFQKHSDNGQQKTVKGGHKQYDLPALDVDRVMRTMKISQADALHLQQLFVDDLREHYEIFRQLYKYLINLWVARDSNPEPTD